MFNNIRNIHLQAKSVFLFQVLRFLQTVEDVPCNSFNFSIGFLEVQLILFPRKSLFALPLISSTFYISVLKFLYGFCYTDQN